MKENTPIEFPTIRRRLVSYGAYYFSSALWIQIFSIPYAIMVSFGNLLKTNHMSVFSGIGSFLSASLFAFVGWQLSKSGMTMRHFISGYKIVKSEDGKPMSFVMLYVREVVVMISAMMGFFKIIVPALLKRSMHSMTGDDHHRIVVQSNGNTFVSKQNLGQMRDSEMNDEVKADAAKQLNSIAENGFFHDGMFKTVAVRASRAEAFKTLIYGVPSKASQNFSHEKKAA